MSSDLSSSDRCNDLHTAKRFQFDQDDHTNRANRQRIADTIPPATIDLKQAGVHPEFLAAWNESVSGESALCEFVSEQFPIPPPEEQPPTFAHQQDAMGVFDLETTSDTKYQFKPVWSRSFWSNTVSALGTCLAFRRPNAQERSAPLEESTFPDYSIPYRILIDFIRTMELICVQHLKHNPSSDDIAKFLEVFDLSDPENSTFNASARFSSDMRNCFWEPPKLHQETSTQTDPIQPHSITDEKDAEVLSPPSLVNASTQTEPASAGFSFSSPPREKSPPQTRSRVTEEQRQSKLSISPPKLSARESPKQPHQTKSPSPKPTSENGFSSRHSPTRVPTRPHIVLTRVQDADKMDYRDVRRAWDFALDRCGQLSPNLFRSSNIHRFRRLGSTGLGIIFRQLPTTKQLRGFIASASKQRGRDAFNRAFRSVSSGGVMISMYDEAHRSPPRPTQLQFENTRNQPCWSPPLITPQTQPPREMYARRLHPRRPPPHRFPTPKFGNAFPMHFPPQPHHFQSQLNQLHQQMHQLMQMQSQIFQYIQHTQHNAF